MSPLTYDTIYDTIIIRGENGVQVDKIIQKMRNQPNGIRPEEARKVLEYYGYRLDRQVGSHMQFINQNGEVLTLPNKNPLRAVYVKDILRRVDE